MKRAMRLAHRAIQPIISAQKKLYGKFEAITMKEAEKAEKLIAASGLPPLNSNSNTPTNPISKFVPQLTVKPELLAAARGLGYEAALGVFRASLPRAERSRREGSVRFNMINSLKAMEEFAKEPDAAFQMAAEDVMSSAFKAVVFEGMRVDGREWTELRKITCNTDVLPMPHGSSFFQRGNTHVLCTTTLGSLIDSKMNHQINGAPDETRKRFVLHYDFPPYCTGEIDSVRVNRRMIGHGALAEKGVRAVLPSEDDFPYLVRVYSECTSSNGSSSMASVCGASLALMDAGVPIKKPVAGLSVGLVTRDPSDIKIPKGRKMRRKTSATLDPTAPWVILTDILGLEDHYGDMDFKIAGTADGITAMQLDIKLLNGVPMEALEEAISASRTARLRILRKMNSTIQMPRYALKPHSPVAAIVRFNPERRRYLLGSGGEMMRYIRTKYDCELEIEDELNETVNTAYIYGNNAELVNEAKSLVQDLVLSVSVGEVCTAVVNEIKDFGATVKITRSQEALLHISELTHDPVLKRKPISELIAVGQSFPVEVLNMHS
jgi:polyribonucleotide nucleotidyltransferase